MASAIADAENLLEMLGLIADETCRALGADEVAISRYDAAEDHLRVLGVRADGARTGALSHGRDLPRGRDADDPAEA